jgi:hypothetical protein
MPSEAGGLRARTCRLGAGTASLGAMKHHTTFTFSQGNPVGKAGYWDAAKLLRRVADTLDDIPHVRVDDITFHADVASEDMHLTVYYHVADKAERKRDRLLGKA